MKKINVLFTVLTIALLSTIVFASNANSDTKEALYITAKITIRNNDYIQDCGEKVTLRLNHTASGTIIPLEQAYIPGQNVYSFKIPTNFTGDMASGVTTSDCINNVVIACPIAQGSWVLGDVVTFPVHVTIQDM